MAHVVLAVLFAVPSEAAPAEPAGVSCGLHRASECPLAALQCPPGSPGCGTVERREREDGVDRRNALGHQPADGDLQATQIGKARDSASCGVLFIPAQHFKLEQLS